MQPTLMEPLVEPTHQRRIEALLNQVLSDPDHPDEDALRELTGLLPEEDGVPLDSNWHRAAMSLLIECLIYFWRARFDFYTGGDMFVYYSLERLLTEDFRGPDFFHVEGVDRRRARTKWVAWEEGGKLPDVIIELMSPTTARTDLTVKKTLYEQTFKTANYYCYDPEKNEMRGWQLDPLSQRYVELTPNARGWLWSSVLHLWVGNWSGEYLGVDAVWPRFFDGQGNLILTAGEDGKKRAEAEWQRAEAERQRADAAEAELAALRAQIANLKSTGRGNDSPA